MFCNTLKNLDDLTISLQVTKLDAWLSLPTIIDAGAVAGSVDQFNRPLYSYPEIAGYYLSYIAYLLQSGRRETSLTENALKIIRHQQVLWSGPVAPPTRNYSPYALERTDWRNEGMFIFDLAMLWRGITDVAAVMDVNIWDAAELRGYIGDFFSSTALRPVRWFDRRPENAPDRWSTRSGPYQLKVLAALRSAAKFQHDQRTLDQINVVLPAIVNEFNQARFHDHNPHSIAYALEGALLLGRDIGIDFSLAREWVSNVAQAIFSADTSNIDYRRSDAIAQLLRLSCCEPYFDPEIAHGLCELLVSTIQREGSMSFTLPPCGATNKNTWPVLFARQALDFYRRVVTDGQSIGVGEFTCLY